MFVLTFTAGQRVAPLSFVLALQHRLPHQVEPGITGQLDLSSRTHFHGGSMQVRNCVLQLGAVWGNRSGVTALHSDTGSG